MAREDLKMVGRYEESRWDPTGASTFDTSYEETAYFDIIVQKDTQLLIKRKGSIDLDLSYYAYDTVNERLKFSSTRPFSEYIYYYFNKDSIVYYLYNRPAFGFYRIEELLHTE
ncbi:hypothetical protein GCM10023093_22070 [Nemorincola caseinilytica]|uniref:Uncharacterized protein n=2 Tax=Nemorincola caseinilytica TaxID=2054315 RepID=A0ABP8NKN2_9BACT